MALWNRRGNDNRIYDPLSFNSLWGFPSFSDVFHISTQFPQDISAITNTQVDWKETDDAHIFKADLPGLKKEEVKVEVEDNRVLKISGERRKEETNKTDTWHRVERAYGGFVRRFRLPENAKVEEIKASMENGVLNVHVPKAPQPKPDAKSIDISS